MAEFKSVLRLQKVSPEGKVLQEEEIDLRRGIFGEGDPTEETEGTAGISYYDISDIENGNVVEWVCVSDGENKRSWLKKKSTSGEAGESITIERVEESDEDGGINVVVFSDGEELHVKNGRRGKTGETGPQGPKGDTGEAGYTPEKGVDYFTDAEKEDMVYEAAAAIPISNYVLKSGTTMTGALVAQSNTNYTVPQVRNVITVADGDTIPSTQPGDFVFIREA